METKIKALIFDCDGILVDSEYSHYQSWREAIQKYGHDLSLDEYYPYVGNSGVRNAELFAIRMGLDCAQELLKEKRSYYHKLQQEGIPAFQTTIDFVHHLAREKNNRGFFLAVASAAKKQETLSNLKRHGIEECFDLVLSGQDDLKEYQDPEGVNKPKPYIYLHAAKMLGVPPQQCVVIEDSFPGVSAGMNAGCITIAVPNFFTKRQDLSQASVMIESFAGMDINKFFSFLETLKK